MPDEETPATGTPETASTETATTTETTTDLGDAGKRALDAERKARKDAEKQATALAARVKEFEDAGKSESEKAAQTIANLNSELTKLRADGARTAAATAAGLDLKYAPRLVGETAEELLEDAKALAADFAPATGASTTEDQPPSRRPKEQLRPGAAPDAAADDRSRDDIVKAILSR